MNLVKDPHADREDLSWPFHVYGASKAESERAGWNFMKENNPHFVFNAGMMNPIHSSHSDLKIQKTSPPIHPLTDFKKKIVNPNLVLGPILFGSGSTAGWINALYNGDAATARSLLALPPQHMVHARDVALLHLAALLEPDVTGERILAFAEPYNFSSLVDTLHRIDPERKYAEKPAEGQESRDLSVVDTNRGKELLRRYGRVEGFDGLEATLRDQLAHVK